MLANKPNWLTPEQLIDINELMVGVTNEPFFVRDRALLESAVARPRNHFDYGEEDIVALACLLMIGVAQNHPFAQGNKRTGYMAFVEMLKQNGFDFDPPNEESIGRLIETAIEGYLGEDELAEELRKYVSPS